MSVQKQPHGVIYRAFLDYIQAAERQDHNRTWLESEFGPPMEWLVMEPEARMADELAESQRARHRYSTDGLYDVTNPHQVYFCDYCWDERHTRVVANWAETSTGALSCATHTLLDRQLRGYAQLFGNEEAALAAFEEEVARRREILSQLGRVETQDEHDWAIMDGRYDSMNGSVNLYPFFNPELEGNAYPTPPESVSRS